MLETKNPAGKGGARDRAKACEAGVPEFSADVPHLKVENPEASRSFGPPLVTKSHRERDDDYRDVVCILSDRWRVIVCRDGLQWIIQRRDGERFGQTRWTGIHYCTSREALIRLSRALQPQAEAGAHERLAALPTVCE